MCAWHERSLRGESSGRHVATEPARSSHERSLRANHRAGMWRRSPRGRHMSDTRISVKRQTARWDPDAEVSVKEAMDFWSFAAAAANVVMQLALPGVGYGVIESKVDSGNILKHPWKRLRTTSQYLAVAVFGSEQDRASFREAVDGAHRQVISTPESPVTVQRVRPGSSDVGGGMPFRRPGGHLQAVAWRDDRRTSRAVLPLRLAVGNHPAGHRRPVAGHPSGVRHLLGRRVPTGRHRPSDPRLSARM